MNKIMAFLITVKQNKQCGRRVTWHAMPFNELKELNKAAKEHGQGSHYFRHLLEATFAAHTDTPRHPQYYRMAPLPGRIYALGKELKKAVGNIGDGISKQSKQAKFNIRANYQGRKLYEAH